MFNFKIVELLCMLFKDEVWFVGIELEVLQVIVSWYLFLGLGLGIWILGDIILEKVCMLQEVDVIYINNFCKFGLYDEVW